MKRAPAIFCTAPLLAFALAGCATMSRGSHATYLVQTIPPGASVTTDLPLENGSGQAGPDPEDAGYYGCAPTPCSFQVPRRSDFNILVFKPGFQPFTWAVTKMRNKEFAKKTDAANLKTASAASAGNLAVALATTSGGGIAAAPAAAGIAGYFVLAAEPLYFAGNGLDLASGALVELYPNPLNVKLAKEQSAENTKEIMDAFRTYRRIHHQLGY